MLYYIAKYLMKAALRLYFSRIETSGLAYIDNGRPTLIIANHTNTFLDAIVAGALLKRKIHFFTRGDVFGNPRAARIFRSLGMIPVYRISEGRDNLQRNDSSMEEAAAILAAGGAVIIFAEGASEPQKVLRPLKKGPFRLAAQVAAGGHGAPLLAPMGINYGLPAQPLTQLCLQGAPATDSAAFTGDGPEGVNKAALQQMRRAAADLSTVAWHVARPGDALLADELLRLKQQLLRRWLTSGEVMALLRSIDAIDDISILPLREAAARYHDLSESLSLREDPAGMLLHAADVFWLIAGSPLGWAGYIFHAVPVFLAQSGTRKWVQDPDYFAPAFLCLSVAAVFAWYVLWILTGCLLSGSSRTAPALILLALCGIFYLKIYRRRALQFASFLRKKRIRRTRPETWTQWMQLRGVLMQSF